MIARLLRTALVRWLSRHPLLAAGIVVVYVLSPFDILPEALAGPAGYLDDAMLLLAGLTLRQLLRRRRDAPAGRPPDAIDTTAEVRKPGNGRPD